MKHSIDRRQNEKPLFTTEMYQKLKLIQAMFDREAEENRNG